MLAINKFFSSSRNKKRINIAWASKSFFIYLEKIFRNTYKHIHEMADALGQAQCRYLRRFGVWALGSLTLWLQFHRFCYKEVENWKRMRGSPTWTAAHEKTKSRTFSCYHSCIFHSFDFNFGFTRAATKQPRMLPGTAANINSRWYVESLAK